MKETIIKMNSKMDIHQHKKSNEYPAKFNMNNILLFDS